MGNLIANVCARNDLFREMDSQGGFMQCCRVLSALFIVGIWLFLPSRGFAQVPGCPDGENLSLSDDTLTTEETRVVCDTVTLGPNYAVAGPDGHLSLRIGNALVCEDGFSVETDGRLTANMCSAIGESCENDNDCCPLCAREDPGFCEAGVCAGRLRIGQANCTVTPCCPGLICSSFRRSEDGISIGFCRLIITLDGASLATGRAIDSGG